MSEQLKANSAAAGASEQTYASADANASSPANAAEPNLDDPRVVMSLLEADQVVAAKAQSHFGRRKFSAGVRTLLWGLRVYVILMLVIVLISVFKALQAAH
ncbi:MAG: hypothetical protein WB780_18355 [Candidatus Acidiferrales bacterium]